MYRQTESELLPGGEGEGRVGERGPGRILDYRGRVVHRNTRRDEHGSSRTALGAERDHERVTGRRPGDRRLARAGPVEDRRAAADVRAHAEVERAEVER